MILVRSIFQLQFGKAREAKEILREGLELQQRLNPRPMRVLTDLTGEFYTLVLEHEFKSLADMEESMGRTFQDSGWKEWYGKLVPLVRSGRREIFQVVETRVPAATPRPGEVQVVMPS